MSSIPRLYIRPVAPSIFLIVWLAMHPCAQGAPVSWLAGGWALNGLASGPNVHVWDRYSMTINDDGTFTGSGYDSTGDVDDSTGIITPSSTGFLISPTGESNPDIRCHVDAGNTVMACTDSWDSNAAYLGVLVRRTESYSMSDLAGDWNISALAAGPAAPWWMRASITVDGAGAFTGSNTRNEGATESMSGVLSLSTDGALTCTSGCGNSGSLQGAMDSGKTVAAYTVTWQDNTQAAGTTEIGVLTRKAQSCTLADLAGRWHVSSIASGPGAPWWLRGLLTVGPDGAFTLSSVENSGSTEGTSGALLISPEGVVTCPTCSDAFYGVMDADKTVIVITMTWLDGGGEAGTTELTICTKDSPAAPLGSILPLLLE